jgi:hemoglobin
VGDAQEARQPREPQPSQQPREPVQPRQVTFYEAMGGEPTFRRLVAGFYRRVAEDDVLRPIYPEPDLSGAEERLRLFLMQYWGGPTTYSERRGHPRLRMRHLPFAVTPTARDRWLRHMRASLDEVGLPPGLDATLWEYLQSTAEAMINTPDEQGEGGGAS